MDLKLAGFSGKSEDFPAWSTKFVALMHTKGLFRTVMGNDDLPEAEPTLPENPNADQMTAYNTKMQERAVLIQQRKDNRNTVWSHLALVLNNTTLMYIKNDCVAADGYGDGTKAWRLLQEKFCSVERPTVVSLVGQLAKLRLGSEEDLDDYFVRSQELMTRLSEAGEAITDTLFNALVINGLPDSFEHFVVQESFQPAKTFTELRTRLRNYDDSRRARCGEKTGNGHIAMQAVRKKKGASGGGCFVCGQKGHLARDCRSRSDSGQSGARGSGSNEASGPTSRKQGCFKCGQQGHFARDCKQAKTGFFSCCATTSMKGDDLIVDTGCTDHVVRDKAVFSSFEKWDEGTTVENPNGTISKIEGIGSVEVDIRDCQDVTRSYTFHNVLFVPSYNVNLMSVSSAIARGSSFSFTSDSSHLVAPDGRRLPVKQRGKLFFLECKFKRNAMTLATKAKMETSSAMLWHRRLGHLNKHDLISVVDVGELGFCEVCTASKMHEVAMPKKTENRATAVGQRVFSDIQGPFEVASMHGARYAVSFIDDFSRLAVVKYLVKKSDTLSKFKDFVAEHGTPKCLRTDNGGEYSSNAFRMFCREMQVKQEFTVPNTPQQNGVAERYNRVITEMTRCLLADAKLSKMFWVRAMSTAVRVRNLCPTSSNEHRISSMEMHYGKPSKVNYLRVFGCLAYYLDRGNRRKLDPKGKKSKFIGYDEESKAYLLMDLETKRVVRARSVTFNEDIIPDDFLVDSEQSQTLGLSIEGCIDVEETSTKTITESTNKANDSGAAASVGVTEDDPVETEELEPPSTEPPEQRPTEIPEQRSTRTRNPPIRYGLAYTHASVIAQEPRSYLEAVSGPEREQWLAAMALEVQSLKAMGTWTLVDRPNSRKVIPGRWVLAVKRDAMGQVERFKARYVVKGFMQVEGLDFNETFAPTCKPETKRILLALGAQDDLVLHQMDVKSAFLNSPLTETVYMEQPEGFSSGDNQVCLLQRSIYGLKQAGRDWYQTLSTFLLETGFTRSTNDFCLFTMRGMDDAMIYVLVWVDDIIIGCKLQAEVDRVRDRFTDRFKMDDRGPLAWFLKMQVKRAPGSVTVNQSRYIEDCLERFGLADCKPVGTSADISTQLTKKDCPGAGSEEAVAMQREDYRGIVGSLLYIAKQTRPDILATVTQLSRFLENPGRTHWVAAKRVLRYLKGTKDLELCYIKDPDGFNLYGSADADWAGDVDDRRSTTGYSFHVQRSGAAISWSTKKQPTAAISTSEAEYQAMAAAVQEGLYLRSLLNEMDMTCDGPTVINEDNQSCIKMCKNPVMQKRTKHIDVKYHFVRERVEDGTFALEYCPTENMEADLLTKSLSKAKVDQHRRTLMGCSLTLDKANSA